MEPLFSTEDLPDLDPVTSDEEIEDPDFDTNRFVVKASDESSLQAILNATDELEHIEVVDSGVGDVSNVDMEKDANIVGFSVSAPEGCTTYSVIYHLVEDLRDYNEAQKA